MSTLNIAIVGANGFIGKHLTENLRVKPDVKLFLFGKREVSVLGDQLPYTKLDLSNEEQISQHFADIDLVYYLASETIPASSWQNPLLEVEKNLKPFIFFTDIVAKLKTKKIVFISSAGTVYGPSEEKTKEDTPTNPFSPYGIIKVAMENFLSYFQKKYNLQFDIYRVSNVYGDGQDTSKGLGIINTFLEKILSEKKIIIFGDGESVRNYIYVKDVAECLSLSLSSSFSKSHVYNLSSNDTLSINSLVDLMKKIVTENFEVIHQETRQSDNTAIDLDNSKLLTAYPKFKLTAISEGITKTYIHLKTHSFQIK